PYKVAFRIPARRIPPAPARAGARSVVRDRKLARLSSDDPPKVLQLRLNVVEHSPAQIVQPLDADCVAQHAFESVGGLRCDVRWIDDVAEQRMAGPEQRVRLVDRVEREGLADEI